MFGAKVWNTKCTSGTHNAVDCGNHTVAMGQCLVEIELVRAKRNSPIFVGCQRSVCMNTFAYSFIVGKVFLLRRCPCGVNCRLGGSGILCMSSPFVFHACILSNLALFPLRSLQLTMDTHNTSTSNNTHNKIQQSNKIKQGVYIRKDFVRKSLAIRRRLCVVNDWEATLVERPSGSLDTSGARGRGFNPHRWRGFRTCA